MNKYAYHYGIKMRIYPSTQQKMMIKINSDTSRFVYNKMIEYNGRLHILLRTKHHPDYYKMIDWLVQNKHVTTDFAKFLVDHHCLSSKTIKRSKLIHCYQGIGNRDYTLICEEIDHLHYLLSVKNLTNHFQFMNDQRIDSLAKANAVQNYRKAWNMFSKIHHAGTPKFHKKDYTEHYQTNCQYTKYDKSTLFSGTARFVDAHHIKVPKLGRLRVSGSNFHKVLDRDDVRIGTVTISKTADDCYFVSMQLASDHPFVNKITYTNKNVGIDLNTENFLTTSDGQVIDNPRYYRHQLKRLKHHQRILKRRERRAKKEHHNLRDAKNYQKERLIIAKLNRQIYNQRENFVNQISTMLINSHDQIVIEDLSTKNLLKNHALAMSISDVGWRKFIDKLTYKAEMYDKQLIKVDPKNTTQTCCNCGYVCGSDQRHDKLTLKDRQWTCPACHAKHIRDVNAAQNILVRGMLTLTR